MTSSLQSNTSSLKLKSTVFFSNFNIEILGFQGTRKQVIVPTKCPRRRFAAEAESSNQEPERGVGCCSSHPLQGRYGLHSTERACLCIVGEEEEE